VKPTTILLAIGAITDVNRSKANLLVEHVLLRQQMVISRSSMGSPGQMHKPGDLPLLGGSAGDGGLAEADILLGTPASGSEGADASTESVGGGPPQTNPQVEQRLGEDQELHPAECIFMNSTYHSGERNTM